MSTATSTRNAINIDENGIPQVAQVDDVLFSSNISGLKNPDGSRATDVEKQYENVFTALQTAVESAGADLDSVGFVRVLVRDKSYKEALNREWTRLWPTENAPARHTVNVAAPHFVDPDCAIELYFIAKIGAKREVSYIDGGHEHASPIPHVAKIGDLAFSSVFTGHKNEDGSKEIHPMRQYENSYKQLQKHVEGAGLKMSEVGYVRNYMRYRGNRPLMNEVFKKVFGVHYPDVPARDTLIQGNLASYVEIQNWFIAVEGATREPFRDETQLQHMQPIADVVKLNKYYFTSRLGGMEKVDGTLELNSEKQIVDAFKAIHHHAASAGLSLDQLGVIEMFVSDPAHMELIDREWKKNFGTENAPARIVTIQPTLKEFNDLTMKLEFIAVA